MAGVTVRISGGDKLEAALKEIASKLSSGGSVKVGFLSGATYPAKAKTDKGKKALRKQYTKRGLKNQIGPVKVKKSESVTSVALVATIMEFGSPTNKIPPRPYFRNMIAKESPTWGEKIGRNLVANNYDVKVSLGQIGAKIESQLRQSIIETNSPPLRPATIERKGFDKPLIDTGHMINSIGSEVET